VVQVVVVMLGHPMMEIPTQVAVAVALKTTEQIVAQAALA
jgi:hypothetical protein